MSDCSVSSEAYCEAYLFSLSLMDCSASWRGDFMLYIASFGYLGFLYVALCEVYAVYAFVTSRLVDVAVYFVCLCVEAS